jgi:DNA adenine methylase
MGGYVGSQATSGLCQPVIALMPPHDTYIETHLGGGAKMKRKPPASHNIGIDLDARALARFRCDYPVGWLIGDMGQATRSNKQLPHWFDVSQWIRLA